MTDLDGVQLVARAPCSACHGDGDVQSDDWESFIEWRNRRPVLTSADEDDLVERYFLEVCDYVTVPPMRTPCERCEGAKYEDTEIPVDGLVEFLLEHVERPLLPPEDLQHLIGQVKRALTNAAAASQGLTDGMEMGSWLRAVQEGSEALRSLGELTARRREM
jgi:hypothetical protein